MHFRCRKNSSGSCTEMGVHFLPKHRLQVQAGLHFPEIPARGRRRRGCNGGVAASGGERKPSSGLCPDSPRLRGPGLRGRGCKKAKPGPSLVAVITRQTDSGTCQLSVTAPSWGHSIPLAWGTILSFPLSPRRLPCHPSKDRCSGHPLPWSWPSLPLISGRCPFHAVIPEA